MTWEGTVFQSWIGDGSEDLVNEISSLINKEYDSFHYMKARLEGIVYEPKSDLHQAPNFLEICSWSSQSLKL
jgi:hypothetical protein